MVGTRLFDLQLDRFESSDDESCGDVFSSVCVCVKILHWQTHRHTCGATVHHRGGKATNADRTRKN